MGQITGRDQEVFDALKYRIVVDKWGTRRYFNSANQLHRINGPAVELHGGHKEWFQNGLPHRADGAAIESPYGYKAWYINGNPLTEAEFNQRVIYYERTRSI
jgi:hypothetical protein